MLECVPNVSEGRNQAVIDALSRACGAALLDVHLDPDHHRSVFTLAGPGPRDALLAARALANAVAEHVDIRTHGGVHPRFGALDVVPFVALDEAITVAVTAAEEFGEWVADTLAVPVFFYDLADPARRTLPEVRRDAFVNRRPDRGPAAPHPCLGATAVGARPVLVAVNCWLDTADVAVAQSIAAAVRTRDGGLPGVRALGLALPHRRLTQVSMNLVDLTACSVEEACTQVRREASKRGVAVSGVELVGLLPASELDRCSPAFREWAGLGPELTIEHRLRAATGAPTPRIGDPA